MPNITYCGSVSSIQFSSVNAAVQVTISMGVLERNNLIKPCYYEGGLSKLSLSVIPSIAITKKGFILAYDFCIKYGTEYWVYSGKHMVCIQYCGIKTPRKRVSIYKKRFHVFWMHMVLVIYSITAQTAGLCTVHAMAVNCYDNDNVSTLKTSWNHNIVCKATFIQYVCYCTQFRKP